jgi:glycosyltransferase involved in cell wall biosynthesis
MKVAIVHFWLVNMRGGEKVLEALLELFPQADIYTHVYNPNNISDIIRSKRVYTSYIQKLPFSKKLYQKYMPLMPNALLQFDLQKYDLVISSESGPAKGVIANPDAFHICYCHTPARYYWDLYHQYYRNANGVTRFFMKRITPALRQWDVISSNWVDHFVANSNYVAKRIERYYNRASDVIFPPVEIETYLATERNKKDFYLFIGQIVFYKRVDIALEACVSLGRKIIVAGAGLPRKIKTAYKDNPYVEFEGHITDEKLKELYSGARALLFPGIEDMGIVPIEANAAGCPVIAYKKGGVLDTVKDGVTGIFFEEQTAASLSEKIKYFESIESNFDTREQFSSHALQCSKNVFKEKFQKIVDDRKRKT